MLDSPLDLSAGFETPNLSSGLTAPRKPAIPHLDDLIGFAKENNLTVGSTTGGRHNTGSKHYSGNAIDIKGSGGFDDATVQSLSQKAAERGFLVRDERTHPKGQKVWGGPHIHIEYAGDPQTPATPKIDLSAGFDDKGLESGLEPPQTSPTGDNPDIVTALKNLSAGVTKQTRRMMKDLPPPQSNADRVRSNYPPDPSLAEVKRAEEPRLMSGIGELRQADEAAVAQSPFVRSQQRQKAGAKALKTNPTSAEARMYDPREDLAQTANDEQARINTNLEWRQKNQPEIDRQTQQYRKEIRQSRAVGGDASKWLAEFEGKAIGGLAELGGGLSDTLRIKAEAAQRAAEEEGADRNVVSKFVQNVGAGFVASAPELAAMSVGVPAPLVFGLGGAARAAGRGEDVFEGGTHGALTGLAFEAPGVGEGLTKTLTKAGAVGAGTTGVELSQGRPLKEAITTGATNALVAGAPEVLRTRPEVSDALPERSTEAANVGQAPRDSQAVGQRVPESGEVANAQEASNQPRTGVEGNRGQPETEVAPHHSERQNRRVTTTETGKAGQFKKGFQEPTPESLLGQSPEVPTAVNPVSEAAPVAASALNKEAAPSQQASQEQTVLPGEGKTASVNRVPAAPAERTSLRNASIATDRAAMELPELTPDEHISWQESLDRARAKGLDKPDVADRIAERVLSGEQKGLDHEQSAGLEIRIRDLQNQHNALLDQIWNEKDPQKINVLRADANVIKEQFHKLSDATKQAGSDVARALAFRRSAINENYDLVSLEREYKATTGKVPEGKHLERLEQYAKDITELQKKYDESQKRVERLKAADGIAKLKRDVDREQRKATRGVKKQSLDDEAAMIRQNIVAELAKIKSQNIQASGLAGLDPEGTITKLILKLARNRVEAGIVKAEDVVDSVHGLLKDAIEGLDRRTVAEVISGYGRVPKQTRSELEAQLSKVKSEMRKALKDADVQSGKVTAKKQGPRETKPQIEKRYQKQIDELNRRISEGDFSEKPKRGETVLDPATQKLKDQLEAKKNEYENFRRRQEKGAIWRNLSGIRKSWMLSGLSTQTRNIGGTGLYQAFDEVARLPAAIADVAMSGVTKQRSITGPSPTAMLDSVLHAGTTGLKEAGQILKQGATREEMERHQYQEINTGIKAVDMVHNAIFRFMSASDRVFYQGAYRRNLLDRAMVQAKNEGVKGFREQHARAEELASHPEPQLDADAKHDALVATFNNSNRLSDAIKRGRSALNGPANFALDLVMPFDRTPTNVIARIIEASPVGYAKNAKQLAKAFINKSMSVEDQRQFSQTFGRATAGSALIGLGWYLADKNKDRLSVDDNGTVMLKIGSHTINLSQISPLGNLIAIGASLRKEHEKENPSKGGYAKAALKPLADQPLLRASGDVGKFITEPDRSAAKSGARFANSFVPFSGALRDIARATDTVDKRYPDKSFTQQFKQNIPILRSQLPLTRSAMFSDEKEYGPLMKELDRLDMQVDEPQKRENETPAQVEARSRRERTILQLNKKVIETFIGSEKYQKLSDKEKKDQLRGYINHIRDAATPRTIEPLKMRKIYPAIMR